MSKVFAETLYEDFAFSFRADDVLYHEKNAIQDLVIFRNNFFGKVMMLDGNTQITTRDEFIYHEMMVHVPLLTLNDAKNILIIGGGDGGIAREVLRHKNIDKCTLVEIDENVVNFSKKHFPEISLGAFENKKLNLIIADGVEFVKNTKEKFDVIIVDSTDPEGPGAVLFTKSFYTDCHRILRKKGILVTQNGVPFLQERELKRSVQYFKEIFKFGTCYLATIPTYIGGQMAIGYATDYDANLKLNLKKISKKFIESGLRTKYYNPEIHVASFALPEFIKQLT